MIGWIGPQMSLGSLSSSFNPAGDLMNWVVAPIRDIVCRVGRDAVEARYNAEIVRGSLV